MEAGHLTGAGRMRSSNIITRNSSDTKSEFDGMPSFGSLSSYSGGAGSFEADPADGFGRDASAELEADGGDEGAGRSFRPLAGSAITDDLT